MLTEYRYLLKSFEWILIVCSKLISMQELMYHMLPLTVLGAVQLFRDALGGRGVSHDVTLCDRGGWESAEHVVQNKDIYFLSVNNQY